MNSADYLLGADVLARHGSRVAIICSGQATTYSELAASVRRAAAAWRLLGVAPGDRVMIRLPDTPAFAAAWLGALHAGAVAVAVNDRLSLDEQRYIFADSSARLFLAAAGLETPIEAFAGPRCVGEDRWKNALREAPADAGPVPRAPGDAAFWLYSSGTTGRPKGIVHSHKDILPAGTGMREVLGLAQGDAVLGTSKLFFAYGLEHGLLGPLSIGATTILHPGPIDPQEASQLVARHVPKAFFSVPSFYRRLLALPPEALKPFAAVRHFVAAGERLPALLQEKWFAATGREILALYGMSETFCASMMTPPGTTADARTGVPLTGVEIRLLDEAGAAVRPGEPGVLWIRHPALAAGYANRPDATKEQFVDGWFCTKDVFTCDREGHYSHQGRADEFIKIAGQWVQPSELEEVAVSDADVAEAACVRISDADGFERLALFVASGADPEAAVTAATRACEQNLPRHKRPKWVRAVAELPRTATGKVQRFKLRELLERELAGKE